MTDLEKKISKQVGWLNYHGGLQTRISCSDVLPALAQLAPAKAMKILKDVEESAAGIQNPTAYILKAASNAGASTAPLPTTLGQGLSFSLLGLPSPLAGAPALDPTGKIARQVVWLNQHAGLKERLSLPDIVVPLSNIDVTAAMKILKDVEQGSSRIERPTSYVTAAAARLLSGEPVPGAARPAVEPLPKEDRAPNASPVGEDEKKIARQVGWLNQNCGFAEKISYSDVKEHLEQLDQRTAMQLLKDVENMKHKIRNPTSYLVTMAQQESERGNTRGGAGEAVQSLEECWDFQQGHCPRGDQCRYAHTGAPADLVKRNKEACTAMAEALGVSLGDPALLELASVPATESEEILNELALGTKHIRNLDMYVAKLCSRVRAEAIRGDASGIVKRLRSM